MNDDSKIGRKFDHGKPEVALLPPWALEEVAKVLTIGAKKYSPDNWKYVSDGENRYKNALGRHFIEYLKGNELDEETGLHHLAHAICCAMFILDSKASGVPLAPKQDERKDGEKLEPEEVNRLLRGIADEYRERFGMTSLDAISPTDSTVGKIQLSQPWPTPKNPV